MRFQVRRGQVGSSSPAIRAAGRSAAPCAALAATLLGAALSGCELLVGTDDFVTSSDAASTIAASSSSTSSNQSTSTGMGGHEDDAAVEQDGSLNQADAGKKQEEDAEALPDVAVDAPPQCADLASLFPDGGLPAATCMTCWQSSCCSEYVACQANAGCVSIAQCVISCTNPPCDCTGSSTAMQLYVGLASCGVTAGLTDTVYCANCEAVGSGDPCNSNDECVGQEYCVPDPFCTRGTCPAWCSLLDGVCAFDSDCAGNYAGGANAEGQQNVCVDSTGLGDTTCFSTCSPSSTNSCSAYSGTTCQSGVIDYDNMTQSICE